MRSSLSHILIQIEQNLKNYFSPLEIQSIKKHIIEAILDIPFHKVFIEPNSEVSPEIAGRISKIVTNLINGIPLQYATGIAFFCDLKLKVNPSVLIPRPETEELIYIITKRNHLKSPKILDIATGSGCIAIALAKQIGNSAVTALDISKEALETATENAKIHGVNINFRKLDILDNFTPEANQFDIVVSNPPYVRKSEKQYMAENVLKHEPHIALFVPDEQPLFFYDAIAHKALRWLKPKGMLYMEINEALGNQVKKLLSDTGYIDIEIYDDFRGKPRFAVANKP